MKRGEACPATLEGCVVRFADKVAYMGRDLEDAITLNIIERGEITTDATEMLGDTNSKIIHNLVKDVVENSRGKDCIQISEDMNAALNALYSFNYTNIYRSQEAIASFKQIEKAMAFMFEEILGYINNALSDGIDEAFKDVLKSNTGKASHTVKAVLLDFLTKELINWEGEKPAQLAIDFIAGMTDSYFINSFKELFLPASSV